MHMLTCTQPTVGLMSALWRSEKTVKYWKVPKQCHVFSQKYDLIQDQLHSVSCMDDL